MHQSDQQEETLYKLIKISNFIITGFFMLALTAFIHYLINKDNIASNFLIAMVPVSMIGVIVDYHKIKLKRELGWY